MRNIGDIIPNGSDICSTADIPELAEIPHAALKYKKEEVEQ